MQPQQMSVPGSCAARLQACDGSVCVSSRFVQWHARGAVCIFCLQDTDRFSWNNGELSLNCGHGTWVTLPTM